MSNEALSTLLFGPLAASSTGHMSKVAEYLRAAWRAQFGQDPATLGVDLDLLAPLYAPGLQPKKLRSLADELKQVPLARPAMDLNIFVPVDSRRGFVTVSGRLLIETASPSVATDPTPLDLSRALDAIVSAKHSWIAQAVKGDGDTRPQTIGFVLFLLLNGSVGASRAFFVAGAHDEDESLATAVVPVINGFSKAIGGSELKGKEAMSLKSNWAVTESHRQLPRLVKQVLNSGRNVEKIYIADGAEREAAEAIAASMRARKGTDRSHLALGLEAAIRAYEDARPLLRSWGNTWETPGRATAIREAVLSAYGAGPR